MRFLCFFLLVIIVESKFVNEGEPGCAQFDEEQIALSGKCTSHKITIDSDRNSSFAISLNGLDYAENTGESDVTVRINRCRFTIRVNCTEDETCSVSYPSPKFKATFKSSLIRFVVKGELIRAEGTPSNNEVPQDIYRCNSVFRALDDSRARYEVRLYLSRELPGHGFEFSGGEIQYYRNGNSNTTAVSSPTQFEVNEPKSFDNIERNTTITVEKTMDSKDGRSTLMDLLIRTRISISKPISK
ncbi:hypothetical protein M3Y98_00954100 [Aphelenchoides besseyi]|nr:hypothetical protein M3Y98_00954100 [Aphelenchoides besseyi]KAI6194602.1 hypothetical protein M3Y96_01142200 [Aphelenchoides besseyi]